MPSARSITKQHGPPQSSPATATRNFEVPPDRHLLITTPSLIYAWDRTGLHPIFKSSRGGFVAATEANDGSGVLAVASKHVVVMHDTKRGQEHSWGLRSPDDADEVRHLEYTRDAQCLFLSTKLTNDIQRYSTAHSRLSSPLAGQGNHSAPVALAVSPTGHLMVSAADDPPTVYIKNLQHNSSPVLLEPRASDAAVCVAAFHPERPNIFLLAFKDGTLAAYDGARILRHNHRGSYPNQEIVNDGEIARFENLHRTTAKTVTKNGIASRAASIAGAAFLGGYKTRAISIGNDGRCRLVDFGDGGIILRTWHAKAPLTSVSVLSVRPNSQRQDDGGVPGKATTSTVSSRHTIGGPTNTHNLIAVGRADGKVHVYDSVGILLAQKTISPTGEKIISVEWASGPAPRPLPASHGDSVHDMSASFDAPTAPLPAKATTPVKPLVANPGNAPGGTVQKKSNSRRRSTTTPAHVLGLPPALRRPDASTAKTTTPHVLGLHPALRRPDTSTPRSKPSTARGDRNFTIHPDETPEGTVRHTPAPHRTPAPVGVYADLFSPVKAPTTRTTRLGSPEPVTQQLMAASSPRRRPRISSQTFVKSAEPAPSSAVAPARPTTAVVLSAESHATSTEGSGGTARPSARRRSTAHISPLKKRHISFQVVQRPPTKALQTLNDAAPPQNENAKFLADLRKMSGALPGSGRQQGDRSTSRLAPPAPITKPVVTTATAVQPTPEHHHAHHAARRGLAVQKAWHPGNVLEREATWPTDSLQSSHGNEDDEDGDIWLTDRSDDEVNEEAKQLRRRPPARQTSRSRVDSKGTYSTTSRYPYPGEPEPTIPTSPIRARFDGSTEDDPYGTAASHITPPASDVFTPDSEAVREHFPRTSSLSPVRKERRGSPKKHGSPAKRERALQEITGNTATVGRGERSPWSKVKAKAKQATTVEERPGQGCATCAGTAGKVLELESEVGRLRGEVLALKAVLRRSGVPLPEGFRGIR